MTDKELNQYRIKQREIAELEDRINLLLDKELSTSHSTVRGSSKHFPYTEFHFGVWVDDPKEKSQRDKLVTIYRARVKEARASVLQIETFISDIPDSELRMIFQYRYIDGMKLREIGKSMNRDGSGISFPSGKRNCLLAVTNISVPAGQTISFSKSIVCNLISSVDLSLCPILYVTSAITISSLFYP